jgi:nucleotide-binding universal stress UspA family protein
MTSFPILIAYDGTSNADDAVALGSLLAEATGAPLLLAHVYPATPPSWPGDGASAREREGFMRQQAQDLLARAVRAVRAGAEVATEALASTTTATGIRTLAERERAALVVFGSARHTAQGRVHPGSASRRLLQVLPCALAIAPVGFHVQPPTALSTLAVASDDERGSARDSAEGLAHIGGARVVDTARAADEDDKPGVLFVGSGPAAGEGQLMLNAHGSHLMQTATMPVVVVPRGRALELSSASSLAVA